MTKLQTVLALALVNNIVAIWKSKITVDDLASEIGELTLGDRQDLEVVKNYLKGNGKAKAIDAHKALERIEFRIGQKRAASHAKFLETVVGVPHVKDETVLVMSSRPETKHADPKAELVAAARVAAAKRGEICRVGAGTNDKALATYVEKRVPSAAELTAGKTVKLADWQKLHTSSLARAKFAKAS
jgi:hypothetical protein